MINATHYHSLSEQTKRRMELAKSHRTTAPVLNYYDFSMESQSILITAGKILTDYNFDDSCEGYIERHRKLKESQKKKIKGEIFYE